MPEKYNLATSRVEYNLLPGRQREASEREVNF
jgi:hypothetical protein